MDDLQTWNEYNEVPAPRIYQISINNILDNIKFIHTFAGKSTKWYST